MNDTQPTGEGMPGGYGKPWRVPTGEWTVSTIDEWISLNPTTWRSVIAFEHKAALAAKNAREVDVICELQQQLAAEREKVQTLVDALKLLADDGPLIDYRAIARTALAKVGSK